MTKTTATYTRKEIETFYIDSLGWDDLMLEEVEHLNNEEMIDMLEPEEREDFIRYVSE